MSEFPSDLISYFVAKQILERRFSDTSAEEFAMWAFLGSCPDWGESHGDLEDDLWGDWKTQEINRGGFKSYYDNDYHRTKTEKLHTRTCVGETIQWDEILGKLQLRRFSRVEIEAFVPPDRWISYDQLLLRWCKWLSEKQAKKLIDNKLDKKGQGFSCELTMGYPVTKIDQTKEDCMYSMSEIEAIEAKELLSVSVENKEPLDGPGQTKTVRWQEAAKRIAEEVATSWWTERNIREITVRGIAPEVAERLSKNREYWGQRGARTESQIRKALKGWRFMPPSMEQVAQVERVEKKLAPQQTLPTLKH
jgi:hypothetical protein